MAAKECATGACGINDSSVIDRWIYCSIVELLDWLRRVKSSLAIEPSNN
jgi:hypothetical protein